MGANKSPLSFSSFELGFYDLQLRSMEYERLPPLSLDATHLLAQKVEGWGENTSQSPAFPFQGQRD